MMTGSVTFGRPVVMAIVWMPAPGMANAIVSSTPTEVFESRIAWCSVPAPVSPGLVTVIVAAAEDPAASEAVASRASMRISEPLLLLEVEGLHHEYGHLFPSVQDGLLERAGARTGGGRHREGRGAQGSGQKRGRWRETAALVETSEEAAWVTSISLRGIYSAFGSAARRPPEGPSGDENRQGSRIMAGSMATTPPARASSSEPRRSTSSSRSGSSSSTGPPERGSRGRT